MTTGDPKISDRLTERMQNDLFYALGSLSRPDKVITESSSIINRHPFLRSIKRVLQASVLVLPLSSFGFHAEAFQWTQIGSGAPGVVYWGTMQFVYYFAYLHVTTVPNHQYDHVTYGVDSNLTRQQRHDMSYYYYPHWNDGRGGYRIQYPGGAYVDYASSADFANAVRSLTIPSPSGGGGTVQLSGQNIVDDMQRAWSDFNSQ